MAKVFEFPKYFAKPHKRAPQPQLGEVIEFGLRTKKSAFLWLKLSLAYEKGISETFHGVDLDFAGRSVPTELPHAWAFTEPPHLPHVAESLKLSKSVQQPRLSTPLLLTPC